MRQFSHYAALDWSGARGERHRGIALAVASHDKAPRLIRPNHIWSRMEICDWLLRQAQQGSDMLIGFDFSSSFAFADHGAYFPTWSGSPAHITQLWDMVERFSHADPHLAAHGFLQHPEIHRHFRHGQGVVGDLFGQGGGRLRIVERFQRDAGLSASVSNFNLVGAAQVGKASLSGMRVLHRVHPQIPLWPLDPLPQSGPCLVETYTSLAARAAGIPKGRSKIRSGEELNQALSSLGSPQTRHRGPISDHQSDALLTAAWLRNLAKTPTPWQPKLLTEKIASQEGWTFGIF
jgi:hypothetical protein